MKPSPGAAVAPRILLVEDDPVSLAFLTAALEVLPARVDGAGSCARARSLAAGPPGHALWMIDANLPDGDGAGLLAELRKSAPRTVALAHTASQRREDLDALIDAGFAEVLVKPLTASALQGVVRRVLGMVPDSGATAAPCGKLPNWDDAAALSALNGQQAQVATLRGLFLGELASQRQTVASALAAGDVTQAGQVLHRLRASCGFVGASRLDAMVRALEREPGSAQALSRFEDAVSDLLARDD